MLYDAPDIFFITSYQTPSTATNPCDLEFNTEEQSPLSKAISQSRPLTKIQINWLLKMLSISKFFQSSARLSCETELRTITQDSTVVWQMAWIPALSNMQWLPPINIKILFILALQGPLFSNITTLEANMCHWRRNLATTSHHIHWNNPNISSNNRSRWSSSRACNLWYLELGSQHAAANLSRDLCARRGGLPETNPNA